VNKLPEKPSELIEVALRDLELCIKDPNYRVDMTTWHAPMNGVCLVCLAGAVMAKSLGLYHKIDVSPSWYVIGEFNYRRLVALNSLRNGHMGEFLCRVGVVDFYGHRPDGTRLDAWIDELHSSYCEDARTNVDVLIPWAQKVAAKLKEIDL
jgi:hypothetical protein